MPLRTHRQQGAPPWRGPVPKMLHDFHLPPDGITALDRFNARADGVEPTPARVFKAANDNENQGKIDDAAQV